jgi:2-oxoglutarate ferredoxin oxidoreductase subunit alpha
MVCVEVQRGGPSTGLPTKTEQADLFQCLGASQGEFPRIIVAPRDVADCYKTTVDVFNYTDRYQCPAIIMTDLLLAEHPETVDAEAFDPNVKIDRGEIIKEWKEEDGKYRRFRFTDSGVSPRALPGTPNALYVSASDDHDEESILISDMFTSSPVRRMINQKRMRKLDALLKEIPAPQLEGPKDADVTLVAWGSTSGVVKEAAEKLTEDGIKTNFLVIKWIVPFHAKEVTELLSKCKKKISVEVNFTSQMAKYVRMETGVGMDHHINKYNGEPYQPKEVVALVKNILAGKKVELELSEIEAREMAYHYLRTHYSEKLRPVKLVKESANGKGEPIWNIEFAERSSGNKGATMTIGAITGTTYSFVKDA